MERAVEGRLVDGGGSSMGPWQVTTPAGVVEVVARDLDSVLEAIGLSVDEMDDVRSDGRRGFVCLFKRGRILARPLP